MRTIDIIVCYQLHNIIYFNTIYSLLHQKRHYSQQRTPEYQIEMGSFSPILKKLVLQINLAPTSKDS
jgi:hypothetical protein